MSKTKVPYSVLTLNTDFSELIPGRNAAIKFLKNISPIIVPVLAPNLKPKKDLGKNCSTIIDFAKEFEIKKTPDGNYFLLAYEFCELEQETLFHFPMDILYILKRTNKPLFNLFLAVTRRFFRQGFGSTHLDLSEIIEHAEYEKNELICESTSQNEIDDFNFANSTIKEIYDFTHYNYPKFVHTIKYLEKKSQSIQANTDNESELLTWIYYAVEWLSKGVDLSSLEDNSIRIIEELQDENFEDICNQGHPVYLYEVFQFTYSGNIAFIKNQIEYLGGQAGNFGSLTPGKTKACHNKEDLLEFMNTSLDSMNKDLKELCFLSESLVNLRDSFFEEYKQTKDYERIVSKFKKED